MHSLPTHPGHQRKHCDAWAAEIKIRAQRKLGGLSKALEKAHKAGQGSDVQLPAAGKSKAAALKEAAVSTSEANRCEKIDEIPPPGVEKHYPLWPFDGPERPIPCLPLTPGRSSQETACQASSCAHGADLVEGTESPFAFPPRPAPDPSP